MITKTDCILLLTDLEEHGVNVKDMLQKTINSTNLPIEVIQFINNSRELSLSRFYQRIRKSYNNKKSKLYINIVKDIESTNEVLITLSALLTQALLFAKDVEDREMFLRHVRANEISIVLANYFKTFDITTAIKLLRIIKADLKALEYIKDQEADNKQ